jgi:hypothetical protein
MMVVFVKSCPIKIPSVFPSYGVIVNVKGNDSALVQAAVGESFKSFSPVICRHIYQRLCACTGRNVSKLAICTDATNLTAYR